MVTLLQHFQLSTRANQFVRVPMFIDVYLCLSIFKLLLLTLDLFSLDLFILYFLNA